MRGSEDLTPWKSLGLFGLIVADLVAYPTGLYLLGKWLGETAGYSRGAGLAGLLTGFLLAFYQIYRSSKRVLGRQD